MKQHHPVPKLKLEKLLQVFGKQCQFPAFICIYSSLNTQVRKIFSGCVELCKCVGVVVAALGCIHTKSNTATKMQHFPLIFNETPLGPAVELQTCLPPKVEPGSAFWLAQSHCTLCLCSFTPGGCP